MKMIKAAILVSIIDSNSPFVASFRVLTKDLKES